MSAQGYLNYIVFNALLLFVLASAIALWLRPRLWLVLFTLFLGLFVGWLDLRLTEVSAAVLLLVTFGLFAGFAQPRRWWLWTLSLGIWVPLFAFVAATLHMTTPTPEELVTSWLALVFPLIGALAGALVRRLTVSQELKLPE